MSGLSPGKLYTPDEAIKALALEIAAEYFARYLQDEQHVDAARLRDALDAAGVLAPAVEAYRDRAR